ncbi:MAG TPA: CzcE family metal-binding protein, partial [Noviherbaspirillum sp.]
GAGAAPRQGKPSLAPSVTSPEDADKTVVIKDTTKHVNVFENETILFIIGDKKFAVKFDGNSYSYDLAALAPAGALNHKVKVFVEPNPKEPMKENH